MDEFIRIIVENAPSLLALVVAFIWVRQIIDQHNAERARWQEAQAELRQQFTAKLEDLLKRNDKTMERHTETLEKLVACFDQEQLLEEVESRIVARLDVKK